jgi:N utilization substance protein B
LSSAPAEPTLKPQGPTRKPAMAPRRRSRQLALQALYPWLLAGAPLAAETAPVVAQARELEGFAKADQAHLDALLHGVMADAEALDAVLRRHVDRPTAQLSPVERGILLIGAFELSKCLEVPYRVAINEAVELAKAFGGTDGHKYVNGVLDKAAVHWRAIEVSERQGQRRVAQEAGREADPAA